MMLQERLLGNVCVVLGAIGLLLGILGEGGMLMAGSVLFAGGVVALAILHRK